MSEKPEVPIDTKMLLYKRPKEMEEYRKLELYCTHNGILTDKDKTLLEHTDKMQLPEQISLMMRYNILYSAYRIAEMNNGVEQEK